MTVFQGTVVVALLLLLLCFAIRIPSRGITRRRLMCPLRGRDAAVDFVIRHSDGEVYADVIGCSLVRGGRRIPCGKPCRSISVVPFGTARLSDDRSTAAR